MENWRQFCVQYAKSVALKFAENWRQFCSKNINNVSADVIVKQFTETLSEELNQHLTVTPRNSCSKFHSVRIFFFFITVANQV